MWCSLVVIKYNKANVSHVTLLIREPCSTADADKARGRLLELSVRIENWQSENSLPGYATFFSIQNQTCADSERC